MNFSWQKWQEKIAQYVNFVWFQMFVCIACNINCICKQLSYHMLSISHSNSELTIIFLWLSTTGMVENLWMKCATSFCIIYLIFNSPAQHIGKNTVRINIVSDTILTTFSLLYCLALFRLFWVQNAVLKLSCRVTVLLRWAAYISNGLAPNPLYNTPAQDS